MRNEVWKVWEGGQSICTTLKELQGCECSFEPHRMRGYGCFLRQPHALFASLGAGAPTCTHCPWRGLHGVAAITLCLLFPFHAKFLALSSSLPSQFLPFWRCNNETASAATALRTINFHKCTQLQDILIAFLSVCVQATPLITLLKQDGSQSCTRYKELHSNFRPWFWERN